MFHQNVILTPNGPIVMNGLPLCRPDVVIQHGPLVGYAQHPFATPIPVYQPGAFVQPIPVAKPKDVVVVQPRPVMVGAHNMMMVSPAPVPIVGAPNMMMGPYGPVPVHAKMIVPAGAVNVNGGLIPPQFWH